jgi:hypothetical protein
MEYTAGWITEGDGVINTPTVDTGYQGNAVKITYDLTSGDWVQIGRTFSTMEVVYDNFDDGAKPNNFSGNSGGMNDNPSAFCNDSFTTDSKAGDYALKLDYGTAGEWSGYWSKTSSDENGYDLQGYGSLEFWVKGSTDSINFKIEIADTQDTPGTAPSVLIGTYTSVTTSYKKTVIPLADFYELDLSSVEEINIVFDGIPSTATVYIDEIKLGESVGELYKSDAFRFRYKGDGASNTLEFKIGDEDNTTFIKKLYGVTNTNGQWNTAVIPYSDLSFFTSGDDDELDLTRISKIWFAISKSEGSSGTLYIDELEYFIPNSLEKIRSNKIINKLEVLNNPFSPNGDGIKDEIRFTYSLSKPARVKLVIYDLAGIEVYRDSQGQKYEDNDYTILWNGKDKSDSRVKNGLYFYKLSAKTNIREDDIKHVLGVLR